MKEETEIEWLRAENSRLWAAMNSTARAVGRIVFSEAWVEGATMRFSILVSNDEEGIEVAAHSIAKSVRAVFGDGPIKDVTEDA